MTCNCFSLSLSNALVLVGTVLHKGQRHGQANGAELSSRHPRLGGQDGKLVHGSKNTEDLAWQDVYLTNDGW